MKATPRLAVTLVFIAFGTMNGSLVGAIPVLREQTHIDTFMFGLITALGTGATIVGMSFAGWPCLCWRCSFWCGMPSAISL
jgi:hypothetical protein